MLFRKNDEVRSIFQYCKNYFQYERLKTREVFIGNTPLGGGNPIRIQSMTNTNTMDVSATVAQTIRMIESGCDYVRITTQNSKAVSCLATIKRELRQAGFDTPLIADVHFNAHVALEAARVAEKVRINPGNYTEKNIGKIHFTSDDHFRALDNIRKNIAPLLEVCKQYGTAIRIGSNQGSLSERIMAQYGDTPEGMVEAALEFIRICNDLNFHNLTLSMKSSNTRNVVFATRLLVHKMMEEGFNYPIHLGVTEAGFGEDGRIKSAVGIGALLTDGIGDTIRVSLTEAPEKEMVPAKLLSDRFNKIKQNSTLDSFDSFKNPFVYDRIPSDVFEKIGASMPPVVIANTKGTHADYRFDDETISEKICVIHGDENQTIHAERRQLRDLLNQLNQKPKIFHRRYSGTSLDHIQLQAATDFGALLIDGFCDGIFIETPDVASKSFPVDLSFAVLQAARSRFSKTEFISCPSCGRTQYDIIGTMKKIQEKTCHLQGITIAVMGCIVNGPGEMAGADYGYIGSGTGAVMLFKGKKAIAKNIPEADAVETLIQLIREHGEWKEPKK